MLGPATTAFFGWVLVTVLIATFVSPASHGWGLFVFMILTLVGVVGGLIHALVIRIRTRREDEQAQVHNDL